MEYFFNSLNTVKPLFYKKTFSDLVWKWFEFKKITVKESTLSTYYQSITKHIIPELGDYKIKELNIDLLNLYISDKMCIKKISVRYLGDIIQLINSILKFAYENKEIKKLIILQKPKITKKDIIILSDEEITQLYYYIKNSLCFKMLGVFISLYTGVRLGEICALKMNDIDIDKRVIKISKTLQRVKDISEDSIQKTKIIITAPKNNKFRNVPISDELFDVLYHFKEYFGENNYLLTNNSHFVEPRNYERYFSIVLKMSKIKKYKYHILRHTFATLCLVNGMDIKTLSEILGHKDIETTSIYLHVSDTHKLHEITKVSKLFVVKP